MLLFRICDRISPSFWIHDYYISYSLSQIILIILFPHQNALLFVITAILLRSFIAERRSDSRDMKLPHDCDMSHQIGPLVQNSQTTGYEVMTKAPKVVIIVCPSLVLVIDTGIDQARTGAHRQPLKVGQHNPIICGAKCENTRKKKTAASFPPTTSSKETSPFRSLHRFIEACTIKTKQMSEEERRCVQGSC